MVHVCLCELTFYSNGNDIAMVVKKAMNKQTFYSKGSEQAFNDDGMKKDAWASCSDGREVWEKYFGF